MTEHSEHLRWHAPHTHTPPTAIYQQLPIVDIEFMHDNLSYRC